MYRSDKVLMNTNAANDLFIVSPVIFQVKDTHGRKINK